MEYHIVYIDGKTEIYNSTNNIYISRFNDVSLDGFYLGDTKIISNIYILMNNKIIANIHIDSKMTEENLQLLDVYRKCRNN